MAAAADSDKENDEAEGANVLSMNSGTGNALRTSQKSNVSKHQIYINFLI